MENRSYICLGLVFFSWTFSAPINFYLVWFFIKLFVFFPSRNYNFNRFSVQGFYFCYWKQNTICVMLLLSNLISLMRKQFNKIRCVLKNSVWVALNHRWFLFHSLILREEQKQYVSSGSSISLMPICWGWDW